MPPSSAESSGVRASGPSSIVPAGTMSPSQRRIQQQEDQDDLPSASSSTTTSSHTTTHNTEQHTSAKLASDSVHFVVVMVGAVVEVLYEMLAAGILRLPYSLHLEGWSGGNPTLALIVVQWAATAAAAGEVDDEDDDEDEDEGGQDESGVPAGWGLSASDWTNCGRNVFPKNSTNRKTMLSSVPSSPYLRSTSISGTTPSSPRFGPSVSGGPSTSTPRTNGSTPTRVKGVVELDWSGASASGSVSGSPRIRPLGWTAASAAAGGGRAMSYGGGGSSSAGAPVMGRRSSASGSIVGSASVPGTPAAGTTSTATLLNSPRFSPFFGAVRTLSGNVPILNHGKARALTTTTGAAGAGPGLGLTSLRLRENEEENEGWDPQERRDGRMRSASISSLASVPELSLGAAAAGEDQDRGAEYEDEDGGEEGGGGGEFR
ncbi:hypothetical protein A4X13_0g2119 [Tilletia indica]|uniref:Uncharacterized protein n=1 Tax=Tilletia indica TaxID=43049 RepID=A0A177TGI9_9BASI|nr:hypothetical protein A4X13_0g2119 [Tilletia indica]